VTPVTLRDRMAWRSRALHEQSWIIESSGAGLKGAARWPPGTGIIVI
jgi:hypothetical protein